ncbi:MAG: glycoside hydrolase family 3 C-terminal domain-containing protein [Anaerolineae bacterium]|nr:glycoside hydrolase family 3 C-terminal domain-containing protein [Anaerolineae bacterium]
MYNKETTCELSRDQIEEKARSLLAQMSLKGKVWMLNGNWDPLWNTIRYRNAYNPVPIKTNGVPGLGISPITFTDGPRGVVMGHATCFPVAMARGASFDRDLERRVGDVIGKEARALGANYFGGVCINLLRHPAWGRAQETYSEDPYHLGEMGAALVEGVQAHNVMACLKHYAVNNIENSRFFVDVKADERTMREVYLPHFKKGVDAGAASVMGAYNLYGGDQACESKTLLTDILRDDWGFEGFTISDFIFGIRDTKKAIEAGLDIEMPMPIHYNRHLLKAVEEERIDEAVIDTAVFRVLRTLLVFENTPDPIVYTRDLVAHPDHIALAKEAAEKSMVLIKNEGNVLPFNKKIKRVLMLGKLAAQENTGDRGSSRIFAPYVITPLAGVKAYFGETVEIIHLEENAIEKAKTLAANVDCVIIVVGNDYNDEGEAVSPGGMEEFMKPVIEGYRNQGMPIKARLMRLGAKLQANRFTAEDGSVVGGDRESLSLKPEEITMIKAVAGINPNTVVTLVCGSMIMIEDWADNIPAVLYSWYGGMEGGNALSRVLFGDVNPSGRLPFTIPTDTAHLPYFSSTDRTIQYDLYHGYTLLDKQGHPPAYPFGFGLSYTRYEYGDLKVKDDGNALNVSVTVTNAGGRDGEEVIQVYVGMVDTKIDRQVKLLKGFDKVAVKAGESMTVTIPILKDDLRYYNMEEGQWVLEAGTYRVLVGPHSGEDVLLEARVNL